MTRWFWRCFRGRGRLRFTTAVAGPNQAAQRKVKKRKKDLEKPEVKARSRTLALVPSWALPRALSLALAKQRSALVVGCRTKSLNRRGLTEASAMIILSKGQ